MDKFLFRQTKQFEKGLQSVYKKRLEWSLFEAKEILMPYEDTAKNLPYYESLYVTSVLNPLVKEQHNQSILRFYAGKHPTGVSSKTINLDDDSITSESDVEDSGCLAFIQLTTGEVWVLVYPSKSKLIGVERQLFSVWSL